MNNILKSHLTLAYENNSFLYTNALQVLAQKMNALGSEREPFFFVVDFLGEQFDIVPIKDLDGANIHVDFQAEGNSKKNIEIIKGSLQFSDYQKEFEQVQKEIRYGNSYLCNLTRPTPINTNASLLDIFEGAISKYKILYKNDWICFSPETFVKIDYRGISSNPMKGTIPADIPNAENTLLQDPKEIAEHYTIVDLIRNDLSMVAENVEVQKFRYISKVQTAKGDLLQTSSKIVGELPADYHKTIGTIVCTLLPAGSISGAPKKKTIEIIKHAESYHRGYYTGVAGIFDGQNLDSCVLIRFIENTQDGFVYKSGGGITKYSEAIKEFEELKQKIYVPTA